ncbi:MAG TPA: ABC transporter permease [Thermoanaerobaculia bacterium]|jgi:putative ABC transport system permease protein
MKFLSQDLRYVLRGLRRSPGFTATAVATLALAIGANTAIFSVVRGVLLRPLPFAQPDRLVVVQERDQDGEATNTGYATYRDWRGRSRSFDEIAVAAYWMPKLSASPGAAAERIEGLRVSQAFFRLLGVRPALGRDFLPAEDVPGANRVVLLSDGLWRRRFAADPRIAGKTVRLGDNAYLVAGVLPRDFESVFAADPTKPTEIFGALGYDAGLPQACRTCRHLRTIARLGPGVTREQAEAELTAISSTLLREYPTEYSATGVFVKPFAAALTARARPLLWTLFAAVGLVLLIGCANVASLLLARAGRRRKEVALRTALGASRARITALFLVEALVLALLGGALGLLTAAWTLQTLVGLAPANLPRLGAVRLEGAVLLFTLGVSVLTGLLFGILPAMRMSRLHVEPVLRESSGASAGRSARRFGGSLVVFDVALALILLSGALLLLKSTSRLLRVDPGFRSAGLLTMEVDVTGARYAEDPAVTAFWDQVLERVAALPGVQSAGLVSQLPLGGNFDGYGVHAQDKPSTNPDADPSADRYGVSADYLRTMGIPVLRGRGFSPADRADSPPVVLINGALGRRVWPGEDPIGKRVRIGGNDGPWRTVVGVVGSVRHTALDAPETPQIYLPRSQFVDNFMVLVVRAANPDRLAGPIRAAITRIDADQPITRVATMERVLSGSAAPHRFSAGLLGAFALLASLLASVGIFGVLSGFVGQRTREIGIRVALGASRQSIVGLVSARTLRLTLAGVAVGLAGSLLLSKGIAGQLFRVDPHDPIVLIAASVLIVAVALLSALAPVRRALRVDPITTLRAE